MRYENVYLEAIAYRLPEEIVSSAEIERRLAPLYERLRLPEGRLELMTGIAERRFWPPGTPPSRISAQAAAEAIERSGVPREAIGALVHGSVCRDYLEPATACGVHEQLGLPRRCLLYDVSDACLGLLVGMVQVANMIELGQIRAGVVVGTESSRSLVETTIEYLNTHAELTREAIKPALASLTIGSGSAAIVLVDRSLSRRGHRLLGGAARAETAQCHLCRGGDGAGGGATLMWTDSETLLREGVAAANECFEEFLDELGWTRDWIDRTFCHQVGRAHQRLLFDTLRLDPTIDFSTYEHLGNTGAVALPITAGIGIQRGVVRPGNRVAMLGIGSGINVLMLGVEWGNGSPAGVAPARPAD